MNRDLLDCECGLKVPADIERCPECGRSLAPMRRALSRAKSRRQLPYVLVIGGAAAAAGYFFFYDTSVQTAIEAVHNQGLMQDRLLGTIAGLACAIIGTILLVARRK